MPDEHSISRLAAQGSEMDLPDNYQEDNTQYETTDNPNEIIRERGEHVITDDLDAVLAALPPTIVEPLRRINNRVNLLEVVMDLGRRAEARYHGSEQLLTQHEITQAELDYVISHIGEFGGDNRAGIERTLH